MRELSVYFCPKCRRYAYFQLEKHARCAKCDQKMLWLNASYLDFIRLDPKKRDELISREIFERSDTAHLLNRINELEKENKKLNETVEWMHQTIWDLLGQKRELEETLAQKPPEAK